jgi:hypothetical protein
MARATRRASPFKNRFSRLEDAANRDAKRAEQKLHQEMHMRKPIFEKQPE